MDVQVTDRNGNAVRGLTRDAFTILEDDVPQEIAELTFVDLPIPSPALSAGLTSRRRHPTWRR